MGITRSKEIDYEKLEYACLKRNHAVNEVCTALGLNANYAANMKSRKRAGNMFVSMLENLYGIKYEDYAPISTEATHDAPKVENQPLTSLSNHVKDELYEVIYAAVYDAVKKAWSE